MKQTRFDRLFVALILLVCSTCFAADVAPSSAPALQSGQVIASAADLRDQGVTYALAGQFDKALEILTPAGKLDDDEGASKALRLIEEYMQRREKMDSERAEEYAAAVQRVERSMLVTASLDALAEAGIGEQLREIALAAGEAYSGAAITEQLESASEAEAAEFKDNADKALVEVSEKLSEAVKLLAEDRSEYAQTFRKLAKDLDVCLVEFRQVWKALPPTPGRQRQAAADKLAAMEEKATDAVADVEAMILSKPWRMGLVQAQLAKQLADEDVEVTSEQWYRDLKTLVEKIGQDAFADANWYDALRVYSGLKELEPDSEQYETKVKATRKHVRMMSLYGLDSESENDADIAKSKPSDSQSSAETQPSEPEEQTTWRELFSGVDVETVREAITRLHEYYVSPVDYRKVGLGALESVKILAETPQAADSFPGLADENKREKFLAAIGSLEEFIRSHNRIDHVELMTALNSVVSASGRTVKIPVNVLAVEFAEGMLDELDRFSSMIWPYDLQDFDKHTKGRFYGVGIQISKERGEPLKVMTPLPDSPALRQGIKAGDIIVAVDGKRTRNLSIDKLVRRITGKKGTRVVLRIKRPGQFEGKDFSIIRAEIVIRTVKGWRRKLPDVEWDYWIDAEDKIGYIRLTQFTDKTVGEINEALEELNAGGVRSLVLDMRFNPGGILDGATGVADEFLASGKMVSTRGRPVLPRQYKATAKGEYLNGDLVVLVNRYSASAAEIVSGAIKDLRRGIIIGERTFGKASVQNVIGIGRDRRAIIKLTTAHYYLPSGRLLHRKNGSEEWGVDPDVKVTLTLRQTKRWLDIRRKTDLIQDIDEEVFNEKLARQYAADFQLDTAVLLLKLKQLQ